MRYRELLEYKRDITTANLGEQLVDAIVQATSSPVGNTASKLKEIIPGIEISSRPNDDDRPQLMAAIGAHIEDVLKFFEDADPTANKQYTEWIIRRYIDGGIRFLEDVDSTVAMNLEIYHDLKTRRMIPPELADIGKVKGANMMRFFRDVYNIYRELPDQVEKAKGNADEFYDDEDIRIVIPNDQTSACYYGQGTQWCTASTKSTNYFDSYDKQGKLYIILPKKPDHEGEKYQLHFASNFYANENDSGVPLKTLIARWPQLHKIFYKEYTNAWNNNDERGSIFLATPETLANWEDITFEKILPQIEKHLETPVSVYNWLGLARMESSLKQRMNNQTVSTEQKQIYKSTIEELDAIAKFISDNKKQSYGVIDDIVLDLTEINNALKDMSITGTISHNIYKMFPKTSNNNALVKMGQERVLRDLRFKINNLVWIAISSHLNIYFEDAFDNLD